MASFTINQILAATQGRLISKGQSDMVEGVSTDSRKIKPGQLFLALRGEKFDGHDYLEQAVASGASMLIVADDVRSYPGVTVIKVTDTLRALGEIAGYHRQRFSIPVIAVTGSNGKTTTKELISAVLATKFPIVKTKLNYNNEIGLPLTLLEIDESTAAVVVEMGMRGKGQIAYLAQIAKPTMGVITNVGVTHIELLGSQEAIAKAKGELISALPAEGFAILNGDDPLVSAMASSFPGSSYFFGLKGINGIDLHIKAGEITPDQNGQYLKVVGRWGEFPIYLPLLGMHNVSNALAALTVGLVLGIPINQLQQAFEDLPEIEKRLKIMRTGGITIIDDTYNASPPSILAALSVLNNLTETRRKIAVLGDMLELGKFSQKAHREIGEAVARQCSALFAFGPESSEMVASAANRGILARHYQDKNDLSTDLLAYISTGDAILVKGSRGMQMEEVVSFLLTHLS